MRPEPRSAAEQLNQSQSEFVYHLTGHTEEDMFRVEEVATGNVTHLTGAEIVDLLLSTAKT